MSPSLRLWLVTYPTPSTKQQAWNKPGIEKGTEKKKWHRYCWLPFNCLKIFLPVWKFSCQLWVKVSMQNLPCLWAQLRSFFDLIKTPKFVHPDYRERSATSHLAKNDNDDDLKNWSRNAGHLLAERVGGAESFLYQRAIDHDTDNTDCNHWYLQGTSGREKKHLLTFFSQLWQSPPAATLRCRIGGSPFHSSWRMSIPVIVSFHRSSPQVRLATN